MKITELWPREMLREKVGLAQVFDLLPPGNLTHVDVRTDAVKIYQGRCPFGQNQKKGDMYFICEVHPNSANDNWYCSYCKKGGDVVDYFQAIEKMMPFEQVIQKFTAHFEIQPVMPRGIYKHYKGQLYRVQDFSLHSETREWMVNYLPLYGKFTPQVRPLMMFVEDVTTEEGTKPRFEFVW